MADRSANSTVAILVPLILLLTSALAQGGGAGGAGGGSGAGAAGGGAAAGSGHGGGVGNSAGFGGAAVGGSSVGNHGAAVPTGAGFSSTGSTPVGNRAPIGTVGAIAPNTDLGSGFLQSIGQPIGITNLGNAFGILFSNSSGIHSAPGSAIVGGLAPNVNVGSGFPQSVGEASGARNLGNPSGINPVAGRTAGGSVTRNANGGFAPAQAEASSRTGLAVPAEDGVSTKIVPAKPCSAAARETDGTTTCVGIPSRR